jgi:TPR repeat protein
VVAPPEWQLQEKIAVYSDLPELPDLPDAAPRPSEAAAPRGPIPTLQPIPELTLAVEPEDDLEHPVLVALQRAANAGDPRAARDLGRALLAGSHGPSYPVEAVRWLERAAEAGDALAAGSLGACLLDGQGTARDTVRARHWLERAQGSRDSTAQFQLGRMLVAGWGGPAEPERGVRLYLLAATQGHADAIFNLASCLDAGYGCEADRLAAKALFLLARTLGSPLRAAGLRVKQREVEAVRALARRFEVTRDIPALLEERRVERGMQLALARQAHEDVQEVRQTLPRGAGGSRPARSGVLGAVTQWLRSTRSSGESRHG